MKAAQSPPHDLEAERAVLGAILAVPDAAWRVFDIVETDDFYGEPHRLAFAAFRDCALNGSGPPDLIRMTSVLRDRGELQRVGGSSFLSALVETLPDVANVGHYCAIIREHAQRRRLIATARAALAAAGTTASTEVRSRLLADLAAMEERPASDAGDLGTLAREVARTSLELHRRGVGFLGVRTGIEVVDEILQGLKGGCMYLLAARPGVGKSALSDQIAAHVASETGRPVYLGVTEMTCRQRAARRLAAVTGIPLPRIHAGRFTREERQQLQRYADRTGGPKTADALVTIESASGRTAAEVRLMVRRFMARHGRPGLVVVDYLQQLRAANPRASMSERTGEKSAQLRELAVELDVPVLVCSQLSRRCEMEGRPPRLSDLRESGDLEQDGHAVAFLYPPNPKEHPSTVAFILAKHRDGPTGKVGLKFRPEPMRFESLNDNQPPPRCRDGKAAAAGDRS